MGSYPYIFPHEQEFSGICAFRAAVRTAAGHANGHWRGRGAGTARAWHRLVLFPLGLAGAERRPGERGGPPSRRTPSWEFTRLRQSNHNPRETHRINRTWPTPPPESGILRGSGIITREAGITARGSGGCPRLDGFGGSSSGMVRGNWFGKSGSGNLMRLPGGCCLSFQAPSLSSTPLSPYSGGAGPCGGPPGPPGSPSTHAGPHFRDHLFFASNPSSSPVIIACQHRTSLSSVIIARHDRPSSSPVIMMMMAPGALK
eukprot:gene17785-biopygen2357